MTGFQNPLLALVVLCSLGSLACGDPGAPPTAEGAGSASPASEEQAATAQGAPAPAEAQPTGVVAADAPVAPVLPAPTAPESWSTTMGELSVDGVAVRDVRSTCGMFRMMPFVQALASSTAACDERAGVTVGVVVEEGRVTALSANGAGAACVLERAPRLDVGGSCQFELTF